MGGQESESLNLDDRLDGGEIPDEEMSRYFGESGADPSQIEYLPAFSQVKDLIRLSGELVATPEKEPLSLVGGILFNGGKELAVIAHSRRGVLQCQFVRLGEGQSVDNYPEGRLLDTRDRYQKVNVVYLGLGAVDILTTASIRQTNKPFYTLLYAKELPGESPYVISLNQDQFLDLMIAKKGGVAVFYGDPLSEENALVLETKPQQATFVFIHPEETMWGLNSVNGAFEFFKRLNAEFLKSCPHPLVHQAAKRLHELVEIGIIKDTTVRLAIFESMVIGHAFRAAANGDDSHRHFLETYLGDLKGWFKSLPQQPPDTALQSMIITTEDYQPPQEIIEITKVPPQVEVARTPAVIIPAQVVEGQKVPVRAKPVAKPEAPKSPFETEKARRIYEPIRSLQFDEEVPSKADYVLLREAAINTMRLYMEARTEEEYKDVIALAKRLFIKCFFHSIGIPKKDEKGLELEPELQRLMWPEGDDSPIIWIEYDFIQKTIDDCYRKMYKIESDRAEKATIEHMKQLLL